MVNGSNHPDYPIDWNDLYGRIRDEEIIAEFAMSFVRNGDKLIHSLAHSVNEQHAEQIEMYAHALKGSASNIGAIRLAKAAWQLEKAVAEQQLEKVSRLFEMIKPEFNSLKALLDQRDWMQQAKNAAQVVTR